MRNLGGAVIRMQQAFDKIKYLVGDADILNKGEMIPALSPFSDKVLDFLTKLSFRLLHDRRAREYGDVIAYAFWIRRVSLEKECQRYLCDEQRIGRGMAFQIAPSNIPVQFAVSMTYALIAGNISVVRLSNKSFVQVDIICDMMRSIIASECPDMASYVCIIRYDHDDAVTRALSSQCDIRMIWGGDNTIESIRKMPVQPRCLDIGFADRYSFAIIDADAYLAMDKDVVAVDFYNDTYYTDQNACSSTRLVVWVGEKIAEAKERFWSAIADVVEKKYKMHAISSSDKLLNIAVCAAHHPGIKVIKKDNLLVRLEIPKLYEDIMEYEGNSGYFLEYDADSLSSIVPLLQKKCQTITVIGSIEDRIRKIIKEHGVRGVDRIVPIGHSMDLSFVWDGYVLPEVLSRQISSY